MNDLSDPETKNNSTVAVNLVLQFLFFELRHSNRVRKWFHRKLSQELDELITKTTIGKLFDRLSIRDLDLGTQFPEIKTIKVHSVDIHPDEGHIDSLDVLLNLSYQGNFKLSIDAAMVLGKKGYLSVRVKQITGIVRLEFTRKPYTHWSLSFVGDPDIDLDIESKIQGRQMQYNVNSLISNQIRKAIRRKHTLPNYKLRFKPFFNFVEEDIDYSEIVVNGTLDITVRELTRLMVPPQLTHVYCVLTMASMPWVSARQHDDRTLIISSDIDIHKAKNQQIGIVFKQADQAVIVDNVLPNTPAARANLVKGDVLISIEGKKVSHINHVAKIIKSLNRLMFVVRIERAVPGLIKNDAILEDYELSEDFTEPSSTTSIRFTKNADTVQIGKGAAAAAAIAMGTPRQSSLDRTLSSSDSSLSNTPSNSPARIKTKTKRKPLVRNDSEQTSTTSNTSNARPSVVFEGLDCFQQHSTADCEINSFIHMDDLAVFRMKENSQYLNVAVFGRIGTDEPLMLGYLNIPVRNVLYECGESSLGQFINSYSLIPPEAPNLATHTLSSHSGFHPDLCYGDVLLSFVWSAAGALGQRQSSISIESKRPSKSESVEKLLSDDKCETPTPPKQHDFIRTHFSRTTVCDFCGKKIWLKDAVQCRDCAMCCHKKCVAKCQNATVCGPVDGNVVTFISQPEFKVTEHSTEVDEFEEIEFIKPPISDGSGHRPSFSDLLVQGIKRVNSANNLNIPGMGSGGSSNQSSRSLPPTPQHTPRKQSLATLATNPFVIIVSILELLPDRIAELTRDQINGLVDPIIGYGTPDELMTLAKTSSQKLFLELEPNERVDKINLLVSIKATFL